jgi:uncharacterized protein
MITRTLLLAGALGCALLHAQEPTAEQKQQVDAAIPQKPPAKPKKPRRLLISNLSMRDGHAWRGSSYAAIPTANYAFSELGRRTGAYQAVFSNDIEMFRPDKIKQFDAICFNNTQGVLFDDAELKKSLSDFVNSGHGIVGFHAAIATFVQHPVYDQWPWFGRMLGGTENGGHPWMPTDKFTVKVDDPKSAIDAMFKGQGFELVDEVMQLQEPSLRDHLHVLLSIDMEHTAPPSHALLPVRAQDKDVPLTWIRSEEKGRVFVSGLGHNPNVFWNAPLLQHFLAGIQFALGDLKADATPGAKQSLRKK